MVELLVEQNRTGWLQSLLVHLRKVPLGPWGEWVTLTYLLQQGWDIVARNWQGRRGELDLIAFEGEVLVIVEVKTRFRSPFVPPEAQVDNVKKRRLETLANDFRLHYDVLDPPFRFDLIAIETEDQRNYELRHYIGFM